MKLEPANRNDLRWRRTERHLMESLARQLESIPLDKVKVTELCRQAEISKATFYLHYQDIYELADAFVDARVEAVLDELGDVSLPFRDVPGFVMIFLRVFRSDEQEEFMRIVGDNRMAPIFMDRVLGRLADRINEKCPVPGGTGPRIAVAYTIGGFISAIQSNPDATDEALVRYLSELMTKTLGMRDGEG